MLSTPTAPDQPITLLKLIKLLDYNRPVTIRYCGDSKPLDAWVLAACADMKVMQIDIADGGYVIFVERELGFGLFPFFDRCHI